MMDFLTVFIIAASILMPLLIMPAVMFKLADFGSQGIDR